MRVRRIKALFRWLILGNILQASLAFLSGFMEVQKISFKLNNGDTSARLFQKFQ